MEHTQAGYGIYDMHFHLDFLDDPAVFAQDAAQKGMALFANTVEPSGFERIAPVADKLANVVPGLGMHPWWIRQDSLHADIEAFKRAAKGRRLFGEVGLDLGPKHVHSKESQIQFFAEICSIAAATDAAVMSIHAVKAATLVLDILKQTGALASVTCIIHWFSGTSDELVRAIKAGCLFSVNKRMLKTRRGKEYVRQIPEQQILLESDFPPNNESLCTPDDLYTDLMETFGLMCHAAGYGDRFKTASGIANRSAAILGI